MASSIARGLAQLRIPVPVALGGTGTTSPARKGMIDGFRLVYVGASAVTVTAGAAYVPGLDRDLVLSADKAFTGLTGLVLNGTQHFYLYDNSGTPDIEISTTLPIRYYGSAFQKTGDSTRRYLGSFLTNASGLIYAFNHDPIPGRIKFQAAGQQTAPFLMINAGGSLSATATLYAGATNATGVGVLAPRGPTKSLLTSMNIGAAGYLIVASGDVTYAPGGNNWDTYVYGGSGGVGLQFEIPVGQSGAGNGAFWFFGSGAGGAVVAYCWGYTFER